MTDIRPLTAALVTAEYRGNPTTDQVFGNIESMISSERRTFSFVLVACRKLGIEPDQNYVAKLNERERALIGLSEAYVSAHSPNYREGAMDAAMRRVSDASEATHAAREQQITLIEDLAAI